MKIKSGRFKCTLAMGVALFCLASQAQNEIAGLQVWPVDALVKVQREATPPKEHEGVVVVEMARNEYEAGQVALRASRAIRDLSIAVSPLVQQTSAYQITSVRANFLGYRYVKANTGMTPISEYEVLCPAEIPDCLRPDKIVSVHPNLTGAIWITIRTPPDCPPGLYGGHILLAERHYPADKITRFPIEVMVYPAVVPAKRTLKVINWAFYDRGEGGFPYSIGSEYWKEDDWQIVEAFARDFYEHRQNMSWVPVYKLVKAYLRNDELRFDFSQLDKFVDIHLQIDPDFLFMTYPFFHGGSRDNQFLTSFELNIYDWPDDNAKMRFAKRVERTTVVEKDFSTYIEPMIRAFYEHLEEKKWSEKFYFSVKDETFPSQADAYLTAAKVVRRLAPKLKIADATRTGVAGPVGGPHVWVPMANHWELFRDFYEERAKAGDEVWYYVCMVPTGYYMNRLLDGPLIKIRLSHWANYKFDISGYLHWGYNPNYPLMETNPQPYTPEPKTPEIKAGFPEGDAYFVYRDHRWLPVPSIRWESQRDGIEDYELLRQLDGRNRQAARRIADYMVQTMQRYSRLPEEYRLARRALLELCSMEDDELPSAAESVLASLKRIRPSGPQPADQTTARPDIPWTLVFEDNFEREELGDNWQPVCGTWAIRNGQLHAVGQKPDGTPSHNHIIVCKVPAPGRQKMEFTAEAGADANDLSGLLGVSTETDASLKKCYFFGFGCEGNAFSKLMVDTVETAYALGTITPGKRHHIVCERDGSLVRLEVDGKEIFRFNDPAPMTGADHALSGIYIFTSGQIDDFKLYNKPEEP